MGKPFLSLTRCFAVAISTTFLLAAEVYPVNVRATAHGFSAAMGKLGALFPAILYNYIDDHTKFWVVCWFGLLGLVLTVVFVSLP
jgi:nitrate/nitrite transporter NarK